MMVDYSHFSKERLSSDFRVAIFSVPVEGWGVALDRQRSEGSLGIVPKVAVVALVKWMERNGFSPETWDFFDVDMLYPTDAEVLEYLRIYRPHVVGLSAVVSTSYTQVKRLSYLIRNVCPDCLIVTGGNLTASSEAVLHNTETDLTVVGDGEVAWTKILRIARASVSHARDVQQYRDVAGVCFLENSNLYFKNYGESVDAKDMFLPDYDILEYGLRFSPEAIKNYFRPALASGWFNLDKRATEQGRPPNIAGIFASKGCVAKCTFCQRSTKGYRVQPYEDLDAHLKELRAKFDVGFIQILDENFGSDKKHSRDIARILFQNNMLWMATGVRCTSITEDDIIFYKENGCSALKFGVESGSQTILDLMEKVFKVSDVYAAIDYCIRHEVYSPLAVMVGMPGETQETAMETGRLVGEISAKMNIHPKIMGYDIFYALPLPGTPLYEYGEHVGVIDRSPEGAGAYLERVTDAGTYKRYYVNLNGAHISEVLFWDVLVALEASRTFHEREGRGVVLDYSESLRKSRELELKNNPRWSLKYTALSFTFITWFLDVYVIGKRYTDYVPRWLVYPLIKFCIYFEFRIQSFYSRNRKNNLFLMDGSSIKRLTEADVEGKSAKSRSLRGVVKRMESSHGESADTVESVVVFNKNDGRYLLSKGL
jgi:anaerobic magnesium-protoporphyrin IX monomethyl ester cyclase